MINKKEINLESAVKGNLLLSDYGGGFKEELLKLRALGKLILYAGLDDAHIFQSEEVRAGISYMLRDAASEIEEGLDYVSTEIIEKMRTAEMREEAEARRKEIFGR